MSTGFWSSYGILWAIVVGETVLLFALLLELGRMRLSRPQSIANDGLPIGTPLPEVSVRSDDGVRPLGTLLGDQRTLVFCALADCPFCGPALSAARGILAEDPALDGVLVVSGPELGPYAAEDELATVTAEQSDVLRSLRVRAFPFAFIVDSEGTILSQGLVNSQHDLLKLSGRASHAARRLKREVIAAAV